MRIEIKAYALGALSTAITLDNISDYIDKQKKVVDTFKAVKKSVYNMNGGVGILDGAVSDLQSRIDVEEQRLEKAKNVLTATENFVDHAKKIDTAVAVKVKVNKEVFFTLHPWARPPKPPQQEKAKENVFQWLYRKGTELVEDVKEGFNNFCEGVSETVNGALEWISDTYNKCREAIKAHAAEIKIALATIALVGCAVLAFVPIPGLAPIAVLGAKMSLGFIALEAVKNTPQLVSGLIDPGNKSRTDVVADFMFNTTFNGISEGVTKINPAVGYSIKAVSSGVGKWVDGGSYTQGVIEGSVDWGISRFTEKLFPGGDFSKQIGSVTKDTARQTVNKIAGDFIKSEVFNLKNVIGGGLSGLSNVAVNKISEAITGNKGEFGAIDIDVSGSWKENIVKTVTTTGLNIIGDAVKNWVVPNIKIPSVPIPWGVPIPTIPHRVPGFPPVPITGGAFSTFSSFISDYKDPRMYIA